MPIRSRKGAWLAAVTSAAVLLVAGCVATREIAMDEAMREGKSPADFPQASADYFADMDGGIALDADEVKGRNTWLVWTGGNEAFWDWLANNSYGTFDLLKTISSFPCSAEGERHAREAESAAGYAAGARPYYRYHKRGTRFAYLGLINEPGLVEASEPDRFGLCLDERVAPPEPFDEEVYGRASGVVGLRIYPNPEFDEEARQAWDWKRYYTDKSYYTKRDLVRPYRVGMSCGFCHVSHHPLRPPADPENPEWRNLSGTIGAQYFWFGRVFAPNVGPDNFVWHLLESQRPGAVDTSFVPTDNLNNPRAMNAIFDVAARLEAAERFGLEEMGGGSRRLPEVERRGVRFGVPHILWDGADSVGVDAALTRVYINIGEYHQEWVQHFKPFLGGRAQTPITVASAQENSVYWNATQERSGNLAKYLIAASGAMRLEDAPGGGAYLRGDRSPERYRRVLRRGKVVFAENCARCHSSKIPSPAPGLDEGPACGDRDYLACWNDYWQWTQGEEFKRRMTDIVLADDFLDDNYLSTDARIPVTLLETEICSAMASNAIEGHLWDNFSSETYKSLPAVGDVELYDPVRDTTIVWPTPGGGRGYQRVPSLVSIWATAPFLHNNEVGAFTGDPTVAGRMAAFDDAIGKLLWPERRENVVHRVRHRVSVDYGEGPRTYELERVDLKVATPSLPAYLRPLVSENWFFRLIRRIKGLDWLVGEGEVRIGPIPDGTPVNLLANINLDRSDPRFDGDRILAVLKEAKRDFARIADEDLGDAQAAALLRDLVPDLVELSACPDFVADRGHYFGTQLADADKEALIEFLKTL